MTRLLLFSLAVALAACGPDSAADGGGVVANGSSAGSTAEPCDVLTPEAVASALGVPVDGIALDTEAMESMERLGDVVGAGCQYTLSADGYDTATITIKAHDDAEAAESYFSSSYRTRTQADLDEIEAAADRAADQLEAEGEDLGGVDAGAMLSGLASKYSFEPIAGVGDQAVVEINHIMDPSVATVAHVREGARIYSVSVGAFPPAQSAEEVEAAREAHVALARAVAGR